mmetsp:Transcript_6648/g.18603  ORF Transcript_6648/g.18603 Transcript_6648/m.18603 type:complete len:94 (-) Transcript_6648:149-430(-)
MIPSRKTWEAAWRRPALVGCEEFSAFRKGTLDFMRTLRKPPQLTPTQFSRRFATLEDALQFLPDAPYPRDCRFSDVDRRRLLYNAMPAAWRTK